MLEYTLIVVKKLLGIFAIKKLTCILTYFLTSFIKIID